MTQQDLIILLKLAEQQKNQRALKFKNRILKHTHDMKLAEILPAITKKLDVNNETTTQLGEILKKSAVEDGNTQTPAIQNITGTRSLLDNLSFKKRSKNFVKFEEKSIGDVLWNGVFIQPLGENRINVENKVKHITPTFQKYFTDTKLTIKSLNNNEKESVFDTLKNVGFYDVKHMKGLTSARKKDALNIPPKKPEILNLLLPAI